MVVAAETIVGPSPVDHRRLGKAFIYFFFHAKSYCRKTVTLAAVLDTFRANAVKQSSVTIVLAL